MAYSISCEQRLNYEVPMSLSKLDDSGLVTFNSLAEPVKIPEFIRKRKIQVYQMRPSKNGPGPGNKVVLPLGSSINQATIEFKAPYVPPDKLAILNQHMDGRYGLKFTPGYNTGQAGADTNSYFVHLQEDGIVPENFDRHYRQAHAIVVKLLVLGVL